MNNLDLIFDIAPVQEKNEVITMDITDKKEEIKDKVLKDFEDSRKNLQDIVNVGAKAVRDLGDLAGQSQSPEHYAALSSLIKNVSEVSSALLKLHKQVEEIKGGGESKVEKHNYIHLASTYEIAHMLKDQK